MKLFLLVIFLLNSVQAMVIPEEDAKGRPVVRQAGVASDANTRVRFVGTHNFSIAGNQTVSSDWTVPQMQYNATNAVSSMAGVQFKVEGGCLGDTVDFQVAHPIAGVLDEFATDYYIFPGEVMTIKEHRAELPAGLLVRVVYDSNCGTAASFHMNLLRYIETD